MNESENGGLTAAIFNSGNKISAFLDEHGMAAQKKFGQNFLINPAAREKLCNALAIQAGDRVWEVGPGLGAETALLLEAGASVCAFEIDRGFCALLNKAFSLKWPRRWTLIEGDVLKTWKSQREAEKQLDGAEEARPLFLFGNLPYNIAGGLIGTFIENGLFFKRCVLTVQKEVAARMIAKPASAGYSSLSVLCSASYDTSRVALLKPANFFPVPNVDSMAVKLELKAERDGAVSSPGFSRMVRALFANRRKTIKNNLEAVLPAARIQLVLEEAEIDGLLRAERLSPESFIRLYKRVSQE